MNASGSGIELLFLFLGVFAFLFIAVACLGLAFSDWNRRLRIGSDQKAIKEFFTKLLPDSTVLSDANASSEDPLKLRWMLAEAEVFIEVEPARHSGRKRVVTTSPHRVFMRGAEPTAPYTFRIERLSAISCGRFFNLLRKYTGLRTFPQKKVRQWNGDLSTAHPYLLGNNAIDDHFLCITNNPDRLRQLVKDPEQREAIFSLLSGWVDLFELSPEGYEIRLSSKAFGRRPALKDLETALARLNTLATMGFSSR